MMETQNSRWFLLLGSGIGLAMIGYLVQLDKRYIEVPTPSIAYYIVGTYIIFVRAGPKKVGDLLGRLIDKISNFTISFPQKND